MALGTVIRSFAAPVANTPVSLCWDGAALWHTEQFSSIYQIDPVTGAVERTIAPPANRPVGVAFDGHSLWVTNYLTATVYQLEMDGTVLRSFGTVAFPRGVAYDGAALWIVGESTNVVNRYSPDGTLARTVALPVAGGGGKDICLDGRSLWICDDNANRIRQVDLVTGTEITSFASPSTNPGGIAWDGRTLWHCDYSADRIYQIMVN